MEPGIFAFNNDRVRTREVTKHEIASLEDFLWSHLGDVRQAAREFILTLPWKIGGQCLEDCTLNLVDVFVEAVRIGYEQTKGNESVELHDYECKFALRTQSVGYLLGSRAASGIIHFTEYEYKDNNNNK